MTVGHITLNGQQYMLNDPLSSSYSQTPYNPMAARLGTGGDYDDLQEWSAWLMQDWRAGVGQTDAREGPLYAELDTRFSRQMFLSPWPRITHLTTRDDLNSRDRGADIVVDGVTVQKVANYVEDTAAGTVSVVWAYLEGAAGTTVTCEIHDSLGTSLAAAATDLSETIPGGHWVRFAFASAVNPSGGFYVVVYADASIRLPTVATYQSALYYDGASWVEVVPDANWAEVYDGSYSGFWGLDGAGTTWVATPLGSLDILRSVDDGDNWAVVHTIATAGAYGNCVATDGNGNWVVGCEGSKAQRSTDDGATWAEVTVVGGAESFKGIDAGGVGVFCMMAESGKIYRSADYGANWSLVETMANSGVNYNVIQTDGNGVWIAFMQKTGGGDSGTIYRSTDDGATWSSADVMDDDGYTLAHNGAGTWIAAEAKIWRSTDGGANWSHVGALGSLVSVAYFNGAFFGTDSFGDLRRSLDGGVTWSTLADEAVPSVASRVAATDTTLLATLDDKIYRVRQGDVPLLFLAEDGLGITGEPVLLVAFNDQMYMVNDNDVWKWSAENNRWAVVGTTGANGATDVQVWNNKLYIACGGNGLVDMDTAESFNVESGLYASLLTAGLGYLWRAYQNDYYYTGDGTTWEGPIEVGPDDYEIRGMAGMGQWLYFSTDEALWFSATGDAVIEAGVKWGVPDETNGRGMRHYQGDIYVPVGRDLYRISEGQSITVLQMGINMVESLPSDRQGRTYALASLNNWLLAAVDPTEDEGRPTVWAHDGSGWHHLINLPPGLNVRDLAFQSDGQYLWVATVRGSRAYAMQIVLPNDLNNPVKDNNTLVQYAPYGWMETDWFHGGLLEIQKDFESVYLSGENLTASQWAKVYWQDDDSTTWEYLGQVTADRAELRWSSAGTRPNSRQIKIGVLIYTTTANESPIVKAVRVKFHPMLTDLFRWNVAIRVADGIHFIDNAIEARTAAQLKTALETVITSVPPVTLVDIDGVSYTVKCEQAVFTPTRFWFEGSTKKWEGVYRLTLRQVVAN